MNTEVDNYLSNSNHQLIPLVRRIRQLVLDNFPQLHEGIKWNAPSYDLAGEDRITFNLHRPEEVQLIFHRGAKPSPEFRFEDETGLLKMVSADRGILKLGSEEDLIAIEPKLTKLIENWINS